MSTVVIQESIEIPGWVVDLESFRRWARSKEFPERGRFSFLDQQVWVDMSPEELYTHNLVKAAIYSVLIPLVTKKRLGLFFVDRCLLSNARAGLSTEADGTFAAWKSLKAKRVRCVEGVEGSLELVGTPDMVLEVVSSSSVRKDTIVLRRRYWRAGISEYWLVDARGDRVSFDVLNRSSREYEPAPQRAGWIRSRSFGKSFKFVRGKDRLGGPQFTLRVR